VIINVSHVMGVIRKAQADRGEVPPQVQIFHPEAFHTELSPAGQGVLVFQFRPGAHMRFAFPTSVLADIRVEIAKLETTLSNQASA
jgi:hypothetical protein